MPFDIRKIRTGRYDVINQLTGESVLGDRGPYQRREDAERVMTKLYANRSREYTSPGQATSGGMVLDSSYQPTFGDVYVDGKKVQREAPPEQE